MATLIPTPVYWHNCPMLGPNTKVPRALLADKNGDYVLAFQHKCPMCSYMAGTIEYAQGVTQNSDGSYSVDTSIAEKLH